jgi:hypothetical protein
MAGMIPDIADALREAAIPGKMNGARRLAAQPTTDGHAQPRGTYPACRAQPRCSFKG